MRGREVDQSLTKFTMDDRRRDPQLMYLHSDNRSAAAKYNDSGLQKYLRVEFDDAIADYTTAIELNPTFAVAYYNRGTVHYRLGNYEKALKDLLRATSLEPQNLEFSEGLRDCQKMLQDEEDNVC